MGFLARKALKNTALAVFFVLASPGTSASDFSPTGPFLDEAQARTKLAREFGPITDPHTLPVVHAALDSRSQELNAALDRVSLRDYGKTVGMKLELVILDTPVPNAVVSIVMGVDGKQKILVGLTTGMIDLSFHQSIATGTDPLRTGLKRLTGVLSHEVAHIIDIHDPQGFEQTQGRKASQAVELRTDFEGSRLLREGNFESDSILDAHKMFKDVQRQGNAHSSGLLGAAKSYLSTHPEHDLRASTSAATDTAQDFRQGLAKVISRPTPEGIAGEISQLRASFKSPDSILETITLLERGFAVNTAHPRSLSLFEHLQELLIKKRLNLTGAEKQAVIEFNMKLNKRGDPYSLGLAATNQADSHYQKLLREVPFYRTSEYLEQVRKGPLAEVLRGMLSPWQPENFLKQLQDLFRIAPPAVWIDTEMGRALGERIAALINEKHSPQYDWFMSRKGVMGDDFPIFYHKHVIPKLSEEKRALLLSGGQDGRTASASHEIVDPYFRYIPNSGTSERNVPQALVRGRKELLNRLTQTQREQYQGVARGLWERRAELGMIDLISVEKTDWGLVFELLEIDPKTGYAKLARSVRELAISPGYADFLSKLTLRPASALELTRPIWAPDDLYSLLKGAENAAVQAKPALSQFASESVAARYIQADPVAYQKHFGVEFRSELAARKTERLGQKEISAMVHQSLEKVRGPTSTSRRPMSASALEDEARSLRVVIAKEIVESSIPSGSKNILLNHLFLEPFNADAAAIRSGDPPLMWEWMRYRSYSPKANTEIVRILSDLGLSTPENFARNSIFRSMYRYVDPVQNVTAFQEASTIAKLLLERARQARSLPEPARTQRLRDVINSGTGPFVAPGGRSKIPSLHDIDWIEMKNGLAHELADFSGDPKEAARLFSQIVGSGATPTTDQVFSKSILPRLDADFRSKYLADLLKGGGLHGRELQIKVMDEVLAPRLQALKAKSVGVAEVRLLLGELDSYVPAASPARDQWIENALWTLGVRDREAVQFAESHKSTHYRGRDPSHVNWASLTSETSRNMSPQDRLKLMDYLISPHGREFPSVVEAAIAVKIDKDRDRMTSIAGEEAWKQTRASAIEASKAQIIQFAVESGPDEKTAAINHLLSEGMEPIAKLKEYPLALIRDYLKYPHGSPKEKILLAFMNTLPEAQRGPALAFMLAHSHEGAASLKPIFVVFSTVGIKSGQLGSLWRLYGEDASKELAELKDTARAMTLDEIQRIMETTLTPQEMKLIKGHPKILGSASIKSVVLVELTDGHKVVMMVRRPHIEAQIETNLKRARDLVAELRKQGLEFKDRAFLSMLDDLESQLGEEIHFSKEVKKVEQARDVMAKLNIEMKDRMGGWKFAVPGPAEGFAVHDHLVFMDYAPGTTLNQMPESTLKKWAGEVAAEGSLKGLWRHGWFDADRHKGNWIVNPETKQIHLIDLGQAESFGKITSALEPDEVYNLAQFMRAAKQKDAQDIVKFGLRLAGSADPEQGVVRKIETEIQIALAKGASFEDEIVKMVNIFSENGVRLDRKHSFGALKGLMVIQQEGYFKGAGFSKAMEAEIRGVLMEKGPLFLKETCIHQGVSTLLQGINAR